MAIAATCATLSLMLEFDEATARQLEIAYQGADIVQRRRASFDAIDAQPDETIVDIGCGNGLLTAELARAVGPAGKIIGVDPSHAMRSAATLRCQNMPWVALHDGLASALPAATFPPFCQQKWLKPDLRSSVSSRSHFMTGH
ncbi:methyltransferase domain-containing protein [Abyssibius alkaniclasticus]|uniref:methyltransferase domain-containing protein n=1 Tax=Abyssibius alkaniclasticus TaxID=2881234 RepID=UPI004059FA90